MMAKQRTRDEWEIREDARTLARAEEIKADRERMREAQQMAGQLADEELNRMRGILKVAGKQPPKTAKNVKGGTPFNKRSYSNPATIGRL